MRLELDACRELRACARAWACNWSCTHAWICARACSTVGSPGRVLQGALLCYRWHVQGAQRGTQICVTHRLSARSVIDALIHGTPIWMLSHS